MPPDKHQHAVGFESSGDSLRDRSFSQEWDHGGEAHLADDSRSLSSQKSDAGYHSSGAMSDGATGNHHAATYSSSSFDHGCYHPLSSMRSVGSTGSQGSARGGDGGGSSRGGYSAVVASHLVNGETRFPTATSYASDAQRSDVATVCSGSVVEDIETESVISADLNVQSSTNPTSPPSSVKMTLSAGVGAINPALDAAAHAAVETVLPQKQSQPSTFLANHHHIAASLTHQPDPPLALHNNMGPPLSRALLLQHPPHHHHHAEGNSSQAGSVKSFESNAGSDVVAHVDTDDCGGSLDMDVHSIHSQEDVNHYTEVPDGAARANCLPVGGPDETDEESAAKQTAVNPLLCSSESNANGRTSPGGTIYKGRGNRRYQGRYMHLPLKRFHQNGVDLGEDAAPRNEDDDEDDCRTHYATELSPPAKNVQRNGWCNNHDRGRSPSPDNRHHPSPRDRSPREQRGNNRCLSNGLNRTRSRSPRSRSRSRSRSRDRSPPTRENNYDDYDNRKPRARRRQHNTNNGSGNNGAYNNHYRGRSSRGGERNGYHHKTHGENNNRSPSRNNRNRRR